MNCKEKIFLITKKVVTAIVLVSLCFVSTSFSKGVLKVIFMYVGQGDATLMVMPNNKVVLIDGGPVEDWRNYDAGRDTIFPLLQSMGINKIDYMFATHPHSDHVGGLKYLLLNILTGSYIEPGIPYPTPIYNQVLSAVKLKKVNYIRARRGMNFRELDPDVLLDVLSPGETLTADDPNNNSLVIHCKHNKVYIMFPGDAEKFMEEEIVSLYGSRLESNILKVGHHGSITSTVYGAASARNSNIIALGGCVIPQLWSFVKPKWSTSNKFLEAVNPEVAVIQCGKNNRYRFPSKKVVDGLNSMNIKVYRTDLNGNVKVTSDGIKYEVTAEK